MPLKNFVAYIDEAGDEGFGKLAGESSGQSNWFSIGAAIVDEANDKLLPSWRDEVMKKFANRKNRDLHFRELNHDQRVHACSTIASKSVGGCVVSSCKVTILDAQEIEIFKRPQHLYNYLTRFLLERVTAACRQKAAAQGARASLRVVFSRRKGTDYEKMREYLEFMRDGKEKMTPVRSIDWSVLDPANIAVENHKVRAGLQIADLFTSAIWKALEPNGYGNCEDRYARILEPRLIKLGGRTLNCGLTTIPSYSKCPLNDEQKAFLDWVIDQRKKARN
ncbi:DUF3800 domain-containing protein [Rhizobium leguminosarum]|nr:DUF3800 domain-containing protein [Rhizobium leguminosarum]TAV93864.1 DUF3800 domain-containing protein [Rhizobium leguminosarum]TAW34941.1 DUF3800 domain-containing protein [Rhizobium leguminosarum]